MSLSTLLENTNACIGSHLFADDARERSIRLAANEMLRMQAAMVANTRMAIHVKSGHHDPRHRRREKQQCLLCVEVARNMCTLPPEI